MVGSSDAGRGPRGWGRWASPGQYAGGRSQGLAEPAEDERGGAGTAEPSAAPDTTPATTPPRSGAGGPRARRLRLGPHLGRGIRGGRTPEPPPDLLARPRRRPR